MRAAGAARLAPFLRRTVVGVTDEHPGSRGHSDEGLCDWDAAEGASGSEGLTINRH